MWIYFHCTPKFKISFRRIQFHCAKVIILEHIVARPIRWGRKYLIKSLYWNTFLELPRYGYLPVTLSSMTTGIHVIMFYCASTERANNFHITPDSMVPGNQANSNTSRDIQEESKQNTPMWTCMCHHKETKPFMTLSVSSVIWNLYPDW